MTVFLTNKAAPKDKAAKRISAIAKRVPKRIKEMQKPGPCVMVYEFKDPQEQAIESQANSAGADA